MKFDRLSETMVAEDANPVALYAASLDAYAVERARILKTLSHVNWSRKLAARKLGISESVLRSRLSQDNNETVN